MQQTTTLNDRTRIGKVDCHTDGSLTVNISSRPSIHVRQCENGRTKHVLYAHDSKYGTVSYESPVTLRKEIDAEDYDKVIKYLRMQTCALDTMLNDAFTNGIEVEANGFKRNKKYMYLLKPHSYAIFCDMTGYNDFQATIVGFYDSESIFDTWTTLLSGIRFQSVEITNEEFDRLKEFIIDMVNGANNLILKYAR